jgi:hypothetical protein
VLCCFINAISWSCLLFAGKVCVLPCLLDMFVMLVFHLLFPFPFAIPLSRYHSHAAFAWFCVLPAIAIHFALNGSRVFVVSFSCASRSLSDLYIVSSSFSSLLQLKLRRSSPFVALCALISFSLLYHHHRELIIMVIVSFSCASPSTAHASSTLILLSVFLLASLLFAHCFLWLSSSRCCRHLILVCCCPFLLGVVSVIVIFFYCQSKFDHTSLDMCLVDCRMSSCLLRHALLMRHRLSVVTCHCFHRRHYPCHCFPRWNALCSPCQSRRDLFVL